jgi:hypothetical protein
MVTNRRGPKGYIRTTYSPDEIDAIAAYCGDTDTCYLLPMSVIDVATRCCCGSRHRKTPSVPV